MYQAFDVNQVKEYSLINDRGEDRTIFLLGVLDSKLEFFLADKTKSFGLNTKSQEDSPATIHLEIDVHNWRVVKYGLKGWKNFKNPKTGEDYPFRTQVENIQGVGPRNAVHADSLDLLKPIIKELAKEILQINKVTEQDEKN